VTSSAPHNALLLQENPHLPCEGGASGRAGATTGNTGEPYERSVDIKHLALCTDVKFLFTHSHFILIYFICYTAMQQTSQEKKCSHTKNAK
jgi:hypothetical protein